MTRISSPNPCNYAKAALQFPLIHDMHMSFQVHMNEYYRATPLMLENRELISKKKI